MNQIRVLVLCVLLLVAACTDDADSSPTPAFERSTPVADLTLVADRMQGPPTPVPDSVVLQADAEYLLLTNLYARASPSVVNIEAEIAQGQFTDTSRGSGFIYDRNGHVVTNAHVVNGAESILVTFEDGFVADAELIGQDNFSDIAVLRVEVTRDRLQALSLANSDLVRVGERAIVIGNPWGLNNTMTTGIVSAIGRQLASAELIDNTIIPGFQNPRILQIDADLNPGNSGGPLLNSYGEVIGINTAIRTQSGTFEGVGFAVPSNTVARVVPELIATGSVTYPWLGITTYRSEHGVIALADELDLSVSSGVLVTGVSLNSPAEDAGLEGGDEIEVVRGERICVGGDIIVAIDDIFINNMDELVYHIIINKIPGDVVTLLVVRDGETFEVPVTLGSRPTAGEGIIPACGER